jgi:hypothetical protein
MPIPAQSIIQRVVGTLNDVTSVRWTIPELIRYFNDGQRDIASLRPDAMNTRTMHTLVAGYKQSIPANGTKLIDINANGTGTKGAVTLVASAILDAQMRNWRNIPGTTEILHYTYDPREPKTFEVYPPALPTAVLDLEYSALPADIAEPAIGTTFADVTGNFAFGDLFANAQQNYILCRCYSKDTEYTANPQRALSFRQDYASDLGVEIKATVGIGPTEKKQASAAQAMQGA